MAVPPELAFNGHGKREFPPIAITQSRDL